MNPVEMLNLLFKYSLLHLYTPVVNNVGFMHPLTFTIITIHNTLSLTYLLLVAAVAYPAFRQKTWLIPVAVTAMWTVMSVSVIVSLNIPAATAAAAILPHGWLEFTALAYWMNALRKATRDGRMPGLDAPPTLREYCRALASPKRLGATIKKDVKTSFGAAKFSLKTLCSSLKKPYLKTLILIASAAFLETYVTPIIIMLWG
jgi:hypothetical protein